LVDPGEGQIRIKVKAAGISPTDLALRAGYLKAIPLPPGAVLGFEAAGTVDAVGPGVAGTSVGDGVAALLFSPGGYAEYAVASIWARKPDTVSWIDAADFGVTLSEPAPDRAPGALHESIALLADGRLRLRAHKSIPCSRPPRPTASWKAAASTSASSSPSRSAAGSA
jgi:hypothetical protein